MVQVPSFCDAQAQDDIDASDLTSLREHAAALGKTKPPAKVAAALKLLAKRGNAKSARNAAKVVATFVAETCGGSSGASNGGSRPACPISAADASAAVGATVVAQGSCIFYPADETALVPNVTFLRQSSFACSADGLEALEYSEPLDGLGTKAYVRQSAEGSNILVCTKQPFEVIVDKATDVDGAVAAAQQLAKQVLGS